MFRPSLGDTVNTFGSFDVICMYEALRCSVQALSEAIGTAMDHVDNIPELLSEHGEDVVEKVQS